VDYALRKTSTSYSDLSRRLKQEHGLDYQAWRRLGVPMGNISSLCHELGLPLLSVRIEYKNNADKTAEGFYNLACSKKPEYNSMTPEEVKRKELELTRNCTEADWQRLLDYLDGKQPSAVPATANSIQEQAEPAPEDAAAVETIDGIQNESPASTEAGKEITEEGSQASAAFIYPDELPDESPEYLEGRKKSVLVNTHERSPAARQACINHYGAVCFICGFNFGEVYGKDCEGMIHVHHLRMISESDSEYIIDPISDLRPVCPNCHMVLHSTQEGYTIDEVKAMLTIIE